MTNWDSNNSYGGTDTITDPVSEIEEDDLSEDTEDTAAEASATAPVKRRARRTTLGADRISRSQVATVLETFEDVKAASSEALEILRTVLRDETATAEVLTGLILTADRADNPLATLAELQESLAVNPFAAAATIAGMQPTQRNRAFAALQAATGGTDTLSKKDVEAATVFGGALSVLTDDEKFALEEAHELLGK